VIQLTLLSYLKTIPTYHRDDLKKFFNPLKIHSPVVYQKRRKKKSESEFPLAQIHPIHQGCSWLEHCEHDARSLPEPEWHAMLSILGRCEDGENLAHEWSKPYKGYSEQETEKKLIHAVEDAGPVTCQRVWELTGGTYCKGCEVWGAITSPINLGTPSKEEESLSQIEQVVKESIASNDPGIVYQKENIEAFRVLKEKSANDFARLKAELKDNLKRSFNLKDFERAIKQAGKNNLRAVGNNEQEVTLDSFLEDVPVLGLKKPDRYNMNMNGIWELMSDEKKHIFPVPLIISQRLKNVDSEEEKIELAYYRDNRWNRIITERSVAMSKSSIVKLADTGLPVHSENAKSIVKFLGAFDAANLDMSYTRSVSHMGWVDDSYDRFLPGKEDGIQIDTSKSMIQRFQSKGTIEKWTENLRPILKFPIARFMLAASFASPLLRIIGHRNFLIYPYGGTRGGKTASLKVALSVWGNPEKTMASFRSTQNSLERQAAFYSDLPMGIDERQVVGDQQGFVESIAYMMGNGQSRGRATRDGKLQTEYTWHNITLATGEDPLSSESSSGGIKSRTLEIYGKPIDDEDVASHMHIATEDAYGVAGPVYIRKVIAELIENADSFKEDYKHIRERLKQECPDNIDSHISAAAVTLLGDIYMNVWFFGQEEDSATLDAIRLGKSILEKLDKKWETDDAQRAYDAFMSWFAIKEHYFIDSEARERYGWIDNKVICVRTQAFKDAMKELGFNERRTRRDWALRGWIEVEKRGNEETQRSVVRKWNSTTKKQEKVIAVMVQMD
jgi:uncharacterized protein (DUF927 family)